MREREVMQAIDERLRAEGLMEIEVRYAGPGADIEGILPGSRRRLFLEAKGERTGTSPRIVVGEALLQLLARWDRDVVCAMAVPYTRDFEKVVHDILPGMRRLMLHVVLVRREGIWHLGPDAAGFFPERVDSLLEALDR